jgi:hypothetical protein
MLDPEAYAAKGTEHANQVALFMWASMPDQQRDFPQLRRMFAIPNGGVRDKITAARLKAEGVKSGVPDICLPVARHGCHGLFIELKRPKATGLTKGVKSANQGEWIEALRAEGFGACVCYGWQEAVAVLKEYLK